MTWDQTSALITAIAALVGALTAVWVQLRANHRVINGRMDQLIEVTRMQAFAAGKLESVGKTPTQESVKCPTHCPSCGSSI